MGQENKSLVFFSKNATPKDKKRGVIFCLFFAILSLAVIFIYTFANFATPYILGMPFIMFVMVALIVIEIAGLVILYKLEG